jgi:hypothetical protein
MEQERRTVLFFVRHHMEQERCTVLFIVCHHMEQEHCIVFFAFTVALITQFNWNVPISYFAPYNHLLYAYRRWKTRHQLSFSAVS